MQYRITIEWSDEDQTYIARATDLGVATHGDTPEQALAMVHEAMDLHSECLDDEMREESEFRFLRQNYHVFLNLTPREHEVCAGIFCGGTLEEIAKVMNVTRERVRQIKSKAIRKITNQMGVK